MIDIYLDKEDDNITASGTKHPRLCMVIQYNRKTLDLKKSYKIQSTNPNWVTGQTYRNIKP